LVEENKKYQCIPSFPLKTIRRYFINYKWDHNFQLVLLFCFKMHAFGPLKVLLTPPILWENLQRLTPAEARSVIPLAPTRNFSILAPLKKWKSARVRHLMAKYGQVTVTAWVMMTRHKLLINRILITRGLYRDISDRGLFCTDRARRTRFVPKDRGPIFICTYRASEVN
jgi:hypothetical protein